MLLMLAACGSGVEGWILMAAGVVVDEFGDPAPGAAVSLVAEDGSLMGTVTSGDEGTWSMPVLVTELDVAVPARIHASRAGYVDGLTYTELLFSEPSKVAYELWTGPGQRLQAQIRRMPPVQLIEDGDDASANGVLLDALTGQQVPRAQFVLRAGLHAPDTEAIKGQGSTDADGAFDVELEPGVYTATVEPFTGYELSRFPVRVVPGGWQNQVGVVAPPPGNGELIASVSWLEGVVDLDLHLSGPLAGTDDPNARYNIWTGASPHPSSGDPVAAVVVETGQLETAVVYDLRDAGDYRLSAMDADWEDTDASLALGQGRVLAQVWHDGRTWSESVSPGVPCNLWRALELDIETGDMIRLQEYESGIEASDNIRF